MQRPFIWDSVHLLPKGLTHTHTHLHTHIKLNSTHRKSIQLSSTRTHKYLHSCKGYTRAATAVNNTYKCVRTGVKSELHRISLTSCAYLCALCTWTTIAATLAAERKKKEDFTSSSTRKLQRWKFHLGFRRASKDTTGYVLNRTVPCAEPGVFFKKMEQLLGFLLVVGTLSRVSIGRWNVN